MRVRFPSIAFVVGDYGVLPIRRIKVTQVFATAPERAGVDYGILYDGESNAGNDVRRVGEEGLYEVSGGSKHQIAVQRILQDHRHPDPHSYNTIRNEYPDFGGRLRDQHYTTLLLQLLQQGRLRVARRASRSGDIPRSVPPRAFSTRATRRRGRSCACWAASSSRWAAVARTPSAAGRGAAYMDARFRWLDKPAHNRMREAGHDPGPSGVRGELPKKI